MKAFWKLILKNEKDLSEKIFCKKRLTFERVERL